VPPPHALTEAIVHESCCSGCHLAGPTGLMVGRHRVRPAGRPGAEVGRPLPEPRARTPPARAQGPQREVEVGPPAPLGSLDLPVALLNFVAQVTPKINGCPSSASRQVVCPPLDRHAVFECLRQVPVAVLRPFPQLAACGRPGLLRRLPRARPRALLEVIDHI
jgi:hypothetical protein